MNSPLPPPGPPARAAASSSARDTRVRWPPDRQPRSLCQGSDDEWEADAVEGVVPLLRNLEVEAGAGEGVGEALQEWEDRIIVANRHTGPQRALNFIPAPECPMLYLEIKTTPPGNLSSLVAPLGKGTLAFVAQPPNDPPGLPLT